MANDHIYTMAEELLATVVDIFDDANVTLPARQFITLGATPPTQDCAHCVITLDGMGSTSPEGSITTYASPSPTTIFSIGFGIWIVRDCWPALDGRNFPALSDIEDQTRIRAIDMWVLYPNLFRRQASGELFDKCQNFFIGRCVFTGPFGAFAGISCPVTSEPTFIVAGS